MRARERVKQTVVGKLMEERKTLRERLLRMGKFDVPLAAWDTPADDTRSSNLVDVAADWLRKSLESKTREKLLARMAQLERAYRKLVNGTYGICESCGMEIPIKRLEAMPEALCCAPCQEERDASGSHLHLKMG